MADLHDDDFADVSGGATVAPRPARVVRNQRTGPMQFVREIRDEMRQVAWPSRSEMVNYTLVVFFTLAVMIALIFFLNYVFGKGIFFMFQK